MLPHTHRADRRRDHHRPGCSGIPTGIITAIKRNTWIDYTGPDPLAGGLSAPAFYIGILLIYVFAAQLGWFPAIGAGDFSDPGANLSALVLPAITLGLVETAYVTRMTRSVMLNVLSDDYVRTARAKGLTERSVLVRHALRAALGARSSRLVGLFTIGLIGSLGADRRGLRPARTRQADDWAPSTARLHPARRPIMVVYALIIVIINIIVDLIYTYVDPRVRRALMAQFAPPSTPDGAPVAGRHRRRSSWSRSGNAPGGHSAATARPWLAWS